MTTPSEFDLSIFPPALAARIAASRALFAGYSMNGGGSGAGGTGGEGADSSSDAPDSPLSDQQGGSGVNPSGGGSSDSESRSASAVDIDPEDESADLSSLPPRVRAYIERLRGEAGSNRVKAKTAETEADKKVKAALKALGVDVDSDTDPLETAKQAAATNEQKAAAEREQRTLTAAELIVWRKADQLGVDAASLADSRSFERAIRGLDPDDAGFERSVTDKIKKIIEDNPRYAAVQVARKGGADLSGRGRKQDNSGRRVSLTDAVSSHYSSHS